MDVPEESFRYPDSDAESKPSYRRTLWHQCYFNINMHTILNKSLRGTGCFQNQHQNRPASFTSGNRIVLVSPVTAQTQSHQTSSTTSSPAVEDAPLLSGTSHQAIDVATRLALERLYHSVEARRCHPRSSSTKRVHHQLNSPETQQLDLLYLQAQDQKNPLSQRLKNQERQPDFYANVGDAIRTLREDIPLLFQKDLNCE